MTIRVPRNHVASPSPVPTTKGLVFPRHACCKTFSSSALVESPSPPRVVTAAAPLRPINAGSLSGLWAQKPALASPIKLLLVEHLVVEAVEAPNDSDILCLKHDSAPSSGK